jgi:seryl-tRNA synthetase
VQKQIGAKKKAKEDASELLQQKVDFEKEKKAWIESAAEKEVALKKKIGTIGNIVYSDVPTNNDEVFSYAPKLRLAQANYMR